MRTAVTLKILFWCIAAPLMSAVFLRLFFLLFRYVYGTLLILIFGESLEKIVFAVSVLTSLVFTVGVVYSVYRKFRIHIMGE